MDEGDHQSAAAVNAPLTTLLMTFEKSGPAQWLGHLDVMRAFERGLRRAGVPIALTQGHNPRSRLRFVFPAGVGLIAWADIVFVDILGSADAVSAECVNACMPVGIRIIGVAVPDPKTLAEGPTRFSLADYRITLSVPPDTDANLGAIAAESLMAAAESPLNRVSDARTRILDVRPFIEGATCVAVRDGRAVFCIRTRFGNAGTVRPGELAELLSRCLPGAELLLMERMRLLTHERDTAS